MDNLVSIVIPTRNRVKDLYRCLELIAKQEPKDWGVEIIIVDDGSSDETKRMISDFKKKWGIDLKYICQVDSHGPATARNRGIRGAAGPYLVFIDDDSFIQGAWLSELMKPFLSCNPRIAGVRGNVISDDDDPSSLSSALGKYIYASADGTTATNNIAYRRSVLLEAGLFDERFQYPAGEDTDLGNRIKDLGYRIVFAPGAVVKHPHENSWEAFRNKSIIRGRGGATYFKKWIFRRPRRGLTVFRPWKAWFYMPLLLFAYERLSHGFWKGAYLLAYHKRFVLKGFLQEVFTVREFRVGSREGVLTGSKK